MASNEVIDAANGDGDAADDPASAGGEVASGVAALAVRYGIGCALAIVTFSSSAVHVCGGHASLAKRLCWAGCWTTTLSVVCSQTLSCADNFRVRVAGVGAMFRDWVAMNCLMEKLPSDNNTAGQLPPMMNQRLADGMTHDQSLQLLLKAVCEAGYWAVLIVPVGFRMASSGLPGVRRGRRRDAVNDPLASDDEDPTRGARQRVHPRPRAGLGAAPRPRLGAP